MADYVVLLHGIMRTKRCMKPLERFLIKNGLNVLNIDYPSTRHDLEFLADFVQQEIATKIKEPANLNFVGFSMGNLVVRTYINKYRPANLGRIVMLAPPNSGSEIADILKKYCWFRKLFGPAGLQLITDQSGFLNLLGKNDYEIGIIAGSRSITPFSSLFLKGPNDGKVLVKRTMLEGMKEHTVVKCSHTSIIYNKKVFKMVLSFLKDGKFAAT